MTSQVEIRIVLYTPQPFVARGVEAVLAGCPPWKLAGRTQDLQEAVRLLSGDPPDLGLVYVSSGIPLAEVRALRTANPRVPLVLWGAGMAGEFVFQAMQLGIRGLLEADESIEGVLSALGRVHRGDLCFAPDVMERLLLQKRIVITPRETQIVSLVAQGLKNKEIAYTLGLREGTIKVYLSRIFRKLDVNDRLDLALYGLKNLFSGQPERHRSSPALDCPRSLPLRSRESAASWIPN